MNVGEAAEELGLEPSAVLRLCRDRGIRASWEESELSEESMAMLRQAVSIPVAATAPAASGPPAAVNPAMVAAAPILKSAPAPGGVPTGEPAFGSIDPRFASVAEPIAVDDRVDEVKRPLTPEVATGVQSLIIAAIALIAWFGAHWLPDWETGRWWLLGAFLALVAGVAALRALVMGVSGVSQVMQFSRARRGKTESAVIAGVASFLLLAIAMLGAYDWHALQIPDAYERLRATITREKNKTAANLDKVQGTIPGDELDPNGADIAKLEVGDCIDIAVAGILASNRVECTATHRYEVVGFVTFSGTTYPGAEALFQESKALCAGPFTAYVGRPTDESRYDLAASYPNVAQWQAGMRRGVCLGVTPRSEKGSMRGADR